jgi:hypothetical protein
MVVGKARPARWSAVIADSCTTIVDERVLDCVTLRKAGDVVVEIESNGTFRDSTPTNGASQRILQAYSHSRFPSAIADNQNVFDDRPDKRSAPRIVDQDADLTAPRRDLDISESDHGDPVVGSDEREGRV